MLILHGENRVQSRRVLNEKIKFFQEREREVIKLDGKKIDLTAVKEACETKSLFGRNRLVVIEGFFSRAKSGQKTEIENYFQELPDETDIIFWEEKGLTPRQLDKFPPQAQKYLFKIEPIIFKFLDSLSPGNPRQSLDLLCQCQKRESPEMIFYMLCRQIRLLLLAKDLGRRGLRELPFWMQDKFLRQSHYFTLEQLLGIHQKLLQIDSDQKKGRALMSLSFQLDLLIANL